MKSTRFAHHPVEIGKVGTVLERTVICRNAEDLEKLDQGILEQSVTKVYAIGTRLAVGDRVFRYAHIKSDATGLGRARVMVATDAGVERGAYLGIQVAGAKTVTWTSVGAITADQYAEGYLLAQGGFVHKIKKNTAAASGGKSVTLTLYEAFAACEAIAANRYGVLLENPYANVGYFSQYGAGMPVGVVLIDPTADYYVWLQTWGPSSVIGSVTSYGDLMAEYQLALGPNVGEEIKVATAFGQPDVAWLFMGGGGISWENENFYFLWLRINP